ncbi:DUF4148 domain-containing protein [Janthinobacterium sp.]|uniref:DUF4148 domain-containing protein n=1 Tax=Janthinobacterium sp. TaxID=1871054 RepID=UPI00293D3D79|nr:DUF4148 domain-containing protein [Janthinobacterium sp.]
MNAKQLIAALLTVAASAAAFAQAPAVGLTRAEVTAELLRARAAGELSTGESDYPKMPPFVSTLSRAQVTAEMVRARAAGEMSSGETDYPKMPAFVGTLTRAEVTAELLRARAAGEIPVTESDLDVAQTRKHVLRSSN